MDNNIYCKRAYKCAICESEYDNVTDRAKCEMACIEKAEQEARRIAEEKKKEDRAMRKAEIDEVFDKLMKLIDEYTKDYGRYEYNKTTNSIEYWPIKLLHNFW